MWQQSNLNTVNLNDYYYNTYLTNNLPELKNMIVDHIWYTGGISSILLNYNFKAKDVYDQEVGNNRIKDGDNSCNSILGEGTICTNEDVENNAKIGLMYLSDYMYGADSKYWGNINYSNYTSDTYKDYRSTVGENWILNDYEWTISRDLNHLAHAMNIYPSGYANYDGVDDADNASVARPTFYVSSSVILSSGDGTRANPYKLVLN